jgi:hypothetical protein
MRDSLAVTGNSMRDLLERARPVSSTGFGVSESLPHPEADVCGTTTNPAPQDTAVPAYPLAAIRPMPITGESASSPRECPPLSRIRSTGLVALGTGSPVGPAQLVEQEWREEADEQRRGE